MPHSEGGGLVISLDFELYWGVHDKRSLASFRHRLAATRVVIPQLLNLFREFEIHATWATVGFLFASGRLDLLERAPRIRPAYVQGRYSPYRLIAETGEDEASDPYHFAPSLIRQVIDAPNQELATHSFSHYYCMENGPSQESWKADLQAAKSAAADFGVDLKSIVFPRNQFSGEHLEICRDMGIVAYRGNPDRWMYEARNDARPTLHMRAGRLADAYIPLFGDLSFLPASSPVEGLINVPASRFLRSIKTDSRLLPRIRIERIKTEMSSAASSGRFYHLWWHPHNFGAYCTRNLNMLRSLLEHASALRDSHGFRSYTMAETAEYTR